MGETIIQGRDELNEGFAWHAEKVAGQLQKAQAKVAGQLQAGEELDWREMGELAKQQAVARIWAKVTRIRDFWEKKQDAAPERADLVEAIHTVRMELLREALSHRAHTYSDPMSNALEQVTQQARQSFLDLTREIYPEGSVLRELGM